jgi:hypothetical protein
MTTCPEVAYDCEGCGLHVYSFGITKVPRHQLCAVCAWLCEHEAPEHLMELRRLCEPGGWVSEREVRRGLREP